MKKMICLLSAFVSFSVMAETQLERDKRLIRDMEFQGELAPEAPKVNTPGVNGTSINQTSLNNTDEFEATNAVPFSQTRMIKVILDKQQPAEAIADELNLELISGYDGQVAVFEADENQNIQDVVAKLKAHSGIIEAKREHVVQLNRPQ